VPNVHEAGISLLGNERLRDGELLCHFIFNVLLYHFSEFLEFQTFFFKSDNALMFLEQVTDLEARRCHLFVWLLITDH